MGKNGLLLFPSVADRQELYMCVQMNIFIKKCINYIYVHIFVFIHIYIYA